MRSLSTNCFINITMELTQSTQDKEIIFKVLVSLYVMKMYAQLMNVPATMKMEVSLLVNLKHFFSTENVTKVPQE